MSNESRPVRPTNFSEGPAPRSRPTDRLRPPGGSQAATSGARRRLPVPMPVATVALVVVLVVAAFAAVRLVGSGTSSDDKVMAAAQTDATPPPAAVAPAATAVPTAPLATRSSAEADAAARTTFIETMKRMGLTPKQADCAADRVQMTIGWATLSESAMDPGKPGQLEELMIACVKG